MQHAVLLRDLRVQVGDQRVGNLDVEDLLQVLAPGQVAVDRVDRESDELRIAARELLVAARELAELGRADGREVGRWLNRITQLPFCQSLNWISPWSSAREIRSGIADAGIPVTVVSGMSFSLRCLRWGWNAQSTAATPIVHPGQRPHRARTASAARARRRNSPVDRRSAGDPSSRIRAWRSLVNARARTRAPDRGARSRPGIRIAVVPAQDRALDS